MQPFFSVERNNFSIFGRGSPTKHFCEIILKSVHWSRRRCHFLVYLFLALVAVFSEERNDFSNFVQGHPRNISMILF